MSEIATLTQRLRDAERLMDLVRDDLNLYVRAYADSIVARWRLRAELEELRDRQLARGNDVY